MKTEDFLAKIEKTTHDELLKLFDSLPAAKIDESIAKWEGHNIDIGHPNAKKMNIAQWWGKCFVSVDEAIPLIEYNDARSELHSDKNAMRGEACLKMMEFRDVISLTMVYDGEPAFDNFRKVNDDILLGCMSGKTTSGGMQIAPNGMYYFWWMKRAKDFPVKFKR